MIDNRSTADGNVRVKLLPKKVAEDNKTPLPEKPTLTPFVEDASN